MKAASRFRLIAFAFALGAAPPAVAQGPAVLPALGAPPPGPLPVFPPDNWWNQERWLIKVTRTRGPCGVSAG